MSSVSFSMCCLVFLIMIASVYFFKQRIKLPENTIYSLLIVTMIAGLIVDISGYYILNNINIDSPIAIGIAKINLIFYFVWNYLMTSYISVITFISFSENKEKTYDKFKKIAFALFFVILTIITILPVSIVAEDGVITNSEGTSVVVLYGFTAISYVYMIINVLKYRKKVDKKKILPLILFFILGGVAMIIQNANPQITLLLTTESIVTALMYFTIENPDVKMIKELDTARAAAEKANRAKSDFLSSMSHEIRTPLNAIVGFSDCILEETTLDAAMSDAKDIKLASQNLLEIVNGILDISKIEANKMEIVETEYELRDTLMNVAKLVKPRIGEKPIQLIENYASDLPYKCFGDGGKLRQIVTNILTNAVKYTEEGSITYTVGCINEGDTCKLVISVEDTGRGIKPEQIDKLFTKFQRLDEDKNTTLEGTGLGLAITKNLAEMMGGKVVVQSVYGQGSKFTVYLSQKIIELVHTEETLMKDLNKMNKLNSDVDLSTKKLLVVDDNKINIKVALKLLSQYSITADSAESGAEAIEKIKANKYDLVLLDDMMPGMSGTETLHKLKEDETYNVPTVALTANALTGMKEKYLDEGFTDYLAKPIEKPELERVLNEYLK